MQSKSNVVPLIDRVGSVLPPQSIETEEEVLGALLLDPSAINRVESFLSPEAFYYAPHQEIYRACLALHRDGQTIDLMMVHRWLHDHGLLDKVGGQARLADLLELVVTSAAVDLHAMALVDRYRRRQLIAASQEIAAIARDLTQPIGAIQQLAEQKIFTLSEIAKQKGLKDLATFIREEADRMEAVSQGDAIVGYKTGFYDFDAITQGLKPQDLIIVAGRPSMGKSAFAASIAKNVAALNRLPVAIFSLEMSGGQIARRLWSADSQVESGRMTAGKIEAHEWERVGQSLINLSDLPISIDESQSVTPSSVLTQCRRLKAEKGALGLIVIDYLHLMLDGADDEVRELGQITRQCKKIARELDVPVMLLSQLSRAVETRNDKRPTMADLRSSGAIEQDADLILMLYRDEYYNPESPDCGIAEVLIRKHRNGAIGTVKLLFEPQFSRFRSLVGGSR